jgi:hypothetical protein
MPKYDQAKEAWIVISRKVVDGRVADTRQGRREALDLTLGMAKQKFEEMRDYLDQLTDINLTIAKQAHAEAEETYRSTLISMFTITGIGLVVGIFLMWGLGRGITNEAFTEVAQRSSKVGELVAEISAASKEQAHGIDQVNNAVTEMDKLTQQNAANAEESASASEEMNSQAGHMKTFVKGLVTLVGSSSNDHAFNKGHGANTKKASGIAKNKIVSSIAAERPI